MKKVCMYQKFLLIILAQKFKCKKVVHMNDEAPIKKGLAIWFLFGSFYISKVSNARISCSFSLVIFFLSIHAHNCCVNCIMEYFNKNIAKGMLFHKKGTNITQKRTESVFWVVVISYKVVKYWYTLFGTDDIHTYVGIKSHPLFFHIENE